MRGFLTVVIKDDDTNLIIEDGGQPFSFVEILQALQTAQSRMLNLMAQAAAGEEQKDGEQTGQSKD